MLALNSIGQRCLSEREPELGLGVVSSLENGRITIKFPGTGEQRLYTLGTSVLKRVQFRTGETVATRAGSSFVIESVEDQAGILTYCGQNRRVREDEISDGTSVNFPPERLLAGQVDAGGTFDLRYRALRAQARFRQSDVRGFLGGRLELLPHQFYILHEVAGRQIPRVLLADEVGLGKTIEACLILQRLLAVGKIRRVLLLVPESLVHQWFVELLRRFNLWFSIFDETRCLACEQSDPGQNPFLSGQWALCSVNFPADTAARREQAISAGWDMVVVDEAHHLEWTPVGSSPSYQLVERLAAASPGLLLLTATPTQLGETGHFARLRLLDPDRYQDYDRFVSDQGKFVQVAEMAEQLLSKQPMQPQDRAELKRLLDQHGPGRVMFRNTRTQVAGFPPRRFCPVPLPGTNLTLLARIARELEAEETGADAGIRYAFRDDPRIDWLAAFLQEVKPEKVLVICKSQRKVAAIEAALLEKLNMKIGLFHEGLPLVRRDRNAAWFAEPDGAQLLLCSEIGSEGRNFQFAHHLVLLDLPLNPGLVEQRIGRLDRIGQTQPIQIHLPYVEGSSEAFVVDWYHRGLDAIETPLLAGSDYQEAFKTRLLGLALAYGRGDPAAGVPEREAFLAETLRFRQELSAQLARGRDRLLELNSFNREVAERVIGRIRAEDADPFLRNFLGELLDHFGVRIKEHEEGDVFLDPSHAFIEGFPSIPREGMLATFSRPRAIVREDIRFLSADHALVQNAVDLLIDSKAGTTAFSVIRSDAPNLLLEAIFVLETVAESGLHVDQFLAPQPVRVVVDLRGNDLTVRREALALSGDAIDGSIQRFLERPGFNAAVLKAMLAGAAEVAEAQSSVLRSAAAARAAEVLGEDLRRLADLRRINDHVRPEEIALGQKRLSLIGDAIARARLRLDSLRLVLEGPGVDALAAG